MRGGVESEVAGGFAVGGHAAFADARARGDPLVGSIDEFLEIGIGDDFLRQVATRAGDA
jgi:hypothetical protein